MSKSNDNAILIFSNTKDLSTLEVIKWLDFNNRKYYLISSINDFYENQISLQEDFITKNISSVWYRKLFVDIPQIETENLKFKNSSDEFLLSELKYFYLGVEQILKNIKSLGNGFSLMDLNKIEVLIEAKKIGINVPAYLLTSSKKELLEFK